MPHPLGRPRPRPGRPHACSAPAAERLEDRTLPTAYVVDTLSDIVAADGHLSLREAIGAANANAAVNEAGAGQGAGVVDTVAFDASLAGGTIALTGGALTVAGDVTVAGPGPAARTLVLDGGGNSRIFDVADGRLTVALLTLAHGRGDDGGAVRVAASGALDLDACEVVDNVASGDGGGVSSDGSLTLRNSTFARNQALAGGGLASRGPAEILNSTFSGNAAATDGGGMHLAGRSAVRNATVAGNKAAAGTGSGFGGGIYFFGDDVVTLHNAVIAGNTRDLLSPAGTFHTADDLTGRSADESFPAGRVDPASSHNAIQDVGVRALRSGVNGNMVGLGGAWALDPVLRDNGGPTETHALRFGSAAIDGGSDAEAVGPDGPLVTDQRGAPRRVGTVDIGAVEMPPSAAKPDAFRVTENGRVTGNLLENDADVEGRPLTVTAVQGNPALVGVTFGWESALSVAADGTFSFDTGTAWDGVRGGETASYSISYSVSAGGVTVGFATVTVTIEGVDDPPVLRDDECDISEQGPPYLLDVLFNDRDADDPIGEIVSIDTAGLRGSATLVEDPSYWLGLRVLYDPGDAFQSLREGETATEVFRYAVRDGRGVTRTAVVTVRVHGEDDRAVVGPDTVYVTVGGVATGNVLSNDSDVDTALAVASVAGRPSSIGRTIDGDIGRITMQADGTFVFDPGDDFAWLPKGATRAVVFNYALAGGESGVVTVIVTGVNDPPRLTPPATVTTGESWATSGMLLGPELADDPDHDALRIAAVNGAPSAVGRAVRLSSGALLTVGANGVFRYDPAGAFARLRAGESATDTFSYLVSDGRGGAATGVATVKVYGGGGEADLLGFTGGEWYVTSSYATSFDTSRWAVWGEAAWDFLGHGDFDGDGGEDVVGLIDGQWHVGHSIGWSFETAAWAVWANADWRDAVVGDLNGDGRDDVAARVGGQWWAALSSGVGFFRPTPWANWRDAGWRDVSLADLDADGDADLLGRLGGEWYAALSNGRGFAAASRWAAWADVAWDTIGVFDADGDGRSDLFGLYRGSWYVGRSNGAAFATSLRAAWAAAPWRDPVAGDFDGDGRDDLAARLGGEWWVNLSGRPAAASRWAAWADVAWQDVRVGDFDGDARDDVAARLGGQWYVGLSGPSAAGGAFRVRLWAAWADTEWSAVSAGRPSDAARHFDGGGIILTSYQPVSTGATSSVIATAGAVSAVALAPPASDDPLLLFWSAAGKDDAFADRLLAGA